MSQWIPASTLCEVPGTPNTVRGVTKRATRENWQARPRKGRGGGREYHISSLPKEARIFLAAQASSEAVKSGNPDAVAGAIAARKIRLKSAMHEDAQKRQREQSLAEATAQTPRGNTRMHSRSIVLELCGQFIGHHEGTQGQALTDFAYLYNHGQIKVETWVSAEVKSVTPCLLTRWHKTARAAGMAALAGRYGNRRGKGMLNTNDNLRSLAQAFLTDHPKATGTHLHKAIVARFKGTDTPIPSRRTVQLWLNQYRDANRQILTALANPDAWKNRHMMALGSASEDVIELNQRWELDSTPADLMLTDGRYSLIGVIDVYSRRLKLLVAKSSRAIAVACLLRRTILDWGVPEQAKTDNGSDYTSKHIKRVFSDLDVEQLLCAPFSGWQKPHIERVFKTFSHDLIELMPGYIGHSVADRQEIDARDSFAERLFKKNSVAEIHMTADDLQRFCDTWVEKIYHQNGHEGLNDKTPAEMVAGWAHPVRRITDERALDILLAEAPGDGWRTVTKKGIHVDRMTYVHDQMGIYAGERVQVRYDPDDMGRIYVFGGDPVAYLFAAECPEVTGVSRQEVAARAKEIQAAHVQQARKSMRAMAKQQNTKDIAQEILAQRMGEGGELVPFPAPAEDHTPAALSAAADAAAGEPEAKPVTVSDQERAEMVRMIADEEAAQAARDESGTDRFRRALGLQKARSISKEEADWLRFYMQTNEFRSEMEIFEEYGPTWPTDKEPKTTREGGIHAV